MIHSIVNRFCMISNWKRNIGPIHTKKCEPQSALSYLRVTVLDFVTIHKNKKINDKDHCKTQLNNNTYLWGIKKGSNIFYS